MGGNDRRPRVAAASRPPRGSWEEQLCLSVGKELWRSLTDDSNKECIYLYKSVAGWDDSAAKEAFGNARARFLAKIKPLPCNVPSPDQNAYIDDIDWNGDSGNREVILEEEERRGWRSSSEGSDRQFVLEGLDVLLDPSFGVGWGPGSWHEENKEEEVKKDDNQERKAWEAAAPVKVVGGGGGRCNCGGNKWYNNSSTRRCNRPINGYQWVPKKMYV